MNKNISLSQLKGKISTVALISIGMVLLAVILGVSAWFTIKRTIAVSDEIKSAQEEFNNNKSLVANLNKLKSNSDYYIKQKEEYDKVIAEEGSYDSIQYYIELDEMCKNYNLEIVDIQVGGLETTDSGVPSARTTLSVIGDEINIKRMAAEIVSQPQLARIDDISMKKGEDGKVEASMTIVNFTK